MKDKLHSQALYNHGGLRTWNERDILLRNQITELLAMDVRDTLDDINPAWRFKRIEGPILTPSEFMSESYSDDDIFTTNHKDFKLRAETTPSSYAAARKYQGKMPVCFWQSGKSFRRETLDGARAAKLRFNEFYQLEFQCLYSTGTKADYRQALIERLSNTIALFCGVRGGASIVESDRLPSYSTSTLDIELPFTNGKMFEVASCSLRNDYKEGIEVCEIAIGLDRLLEIRHLQEMAK